jgi:hypothetical protein
MFGHQDDQSNTTGSTEVNNLPADLVAEVPAAAADAPITDTTTAATTVNPPSTDASPATTDTSSGDPLKDVLSPAGGYPIRASEKVHKGESSSDDLLEVPGANGDLAAIKIQALDELYPLIDKLNLNPDERYKTLMMMIQASDNQELVKAAYDAAHGIPDEKIKAQALLDIVNEINYFTQNPGE